MIGAPAIATASRAPSPPPTAPGTVLLHPDGRPGDPKACRLMARSEPHDGWPWFRLTGHPTDVPSRGDDLRGWTVQPLHQVGQVLGT